MSSVRPAASLSSSHPQFALSSAWRLLGSSRPHLVFVLRSPCSLSSPSPVLAILGSSCPQFASYSFCLVLISPHSHFPLFSVRPILIWSCPQLVSASFRLVLSWPHPHFASSSVRHILSSPGLTSLRHLCALPSVRPVFFSPCLSSPHTHLGLSSFRPILIWSRPQLAASSKPHVH